MVGINNEFDDRLRRISSQRAQLKRGYSLRVDRDGLIVARPKSARRYAPFRGLVLLLVGFVGFKALLIAYLGEGTYRDRVDALRSGATVEQAGAWFMQTDPVSATLAKQMRGWFR